MNTVYKNNEKEKTKRIIIVALAAVVIAMVILLGFILSRTHGGSDTSPQDTNSDFIIDPNAGDGVTITEGPKKADSIKIPGYPSITIAADTPNVRMALLNPEGNPCYFKFEIVLKDTGETIYESQYVPAGKTINDVTLTHGLSKGEHPATIKITTIALDQKTPLNGANVETVLIAK